MPAQKRSLPESLDEGDTSQQNLFHSRHAKQQQQQPDQPQEHDEENHEDENEEEEEEGDEEEGEEEEARFVVNYCGNMKMMKQKEKGTENKGGEKLNTMY